MSKRKKFEDWKIQLDILCQRELRSHVEDLSLQLHLEEDLREAWHDGVSPREYVHEIVNLLGEDVEPDTFDVKYEL